MYWLIWVSVGMATACASVRPAFSDPSVFTRFEPDLLFASSPPMPTGEPIRNVDQAEAVVKLVLLPRTMVLPRSLAYKLPSIKVCGIPRLESLL